MGSRSALKQPHDSLGTPSFVGAWFTDWGLQGLERCSSLSPPAALHQPTPS